MKFLIGIDDTDDAGSIGTEGLLEQMGILLKETGIGIPGRITQYPLLIRDDIPCTTENKSACDEWEIKEEDFGKAVTFALEFLKKNAAKNSDPGLCVIKAEALESDMIKRLTSYGKCARVMIMRSWEAHKLADSMEEQIRLIAVGNAGNGVIGALAACALRLLEA